MSGINTLYNTKLQSSLNLNNQGLTGTTPAKRFIEKNIGAANKTIDSSDMGKLLKFSGSRQLVFTADIAGVTAGDTFTASSNIAISYLGSGATVYNSFSDAYTNAIIQFIYVGNNKWFLINTN